MRVKLEIGEAYEFEYELVEITERRAGESRAYLNFGAFEVYRREMSAEVHRITSCTKVWVLAQKEHTQYLIDRLASGMIMAKRFDDQGKSVELWMARNILKKLQGGE